MHFPINRLYFTKNLLLFLALVIFAYSTPRIKDHEDRSKLEFYVVKAIIDETKCFARV